MKCPACKNEIDFKDALSLCPSYWPELDVVNCTFPCCGQNQEVQLRPGKVTIGYVYAAGAPHFCGVDEVTLPDLEVVRNSDHLKVRFGETTYTIARRPKVDATGEQVMDVNRT